MMIYLLVHISCIQDMKRSLSWQHLSTVYRKCFKVRYLKKKFNTEIIVTWTFLATAATCATSWFEPFFDDIRRRHSDNNFCQRSLPCSATKLVDILSQGKKRRKILLMLLNNNLSVKIVKNFFMFQITKMYITFRTLKWQNPKKTHLKNVGLRLVSTQKAF